MSATVRRKEEVFRITLKKSVFSPRDVDVSAHVFKPTETDPNAGLRPWPVGTAWLHKHGF